MCLSSWRYDLGGSTCACTLQWDKAQYWQRLFHGQKYVVGHVITAFTGPFFVACWEWNLLYKVLNEVLEELATPIYGKWAATGTPMDIEPRYDSLINDLVLNGLVFILLAFHVMHVLEIPGITSNSQHWDCYSVYTLFVAIFQYYTLQEVQKLWEIFGLHALPIPFGLSCFPGYIGAFVLQIAYLRLIWAMWAWPVHAYWKLVACLFVLWCPFTFFNHPDNYHEQIQAVLSFALTGSLVSVYQYVYKIGNPYLLIVATVCYVPAIVFYALITSNHPIVSPPQDPEYSKRNTCGLYNQSWSDSCSALTMSLQT